MHVVVVRCDAADRDELTDPIPCFMLNSGFRAGALDTLPTPPVPFALSATDSGHTDRARRGGADGGRPVVEGAD